jgi:O-succinylbenzoic acid--CoA ligase
MDRAELSEIVRATGCAETCGGYTLLCDPHWGPEERAQLAEIKAGIENQNAEIATGWLGIASGGTGGRLKFACHDEHTLGAAAAGFCDYFGLRRVNAVDVLPAFHVSGLMARVRCATTGGAHLPWSWKQLETGRRPSLPTAADGWVLSLVPTQLQRLLGVGETVAWLRQFRAVFVGGGPAWGELTEAAASLGVRVALSYGMTETAAMVTALRPEEFEAGARDCGAELPHARVTIVDDASGAPLATGETGLVRVSGASVFRGYVGGRETANPEEAPNDERSFTTCDLGLMDTAGRLRVLGRRDAVIITGGKKVFPAEVEAALSASGQFGDVVVLGVADAEWGQRVVACYPTDFPAPDFTRVGLALAELAAFKRPKEFRALETWPRSAQGKVNRAALAECISR